MQKLDFGVDADTHAKGTRPAGPSIHDPDIVQEGDRYYIFGTHMMAAVSENLRDWKVIGEGFRPENAVFGKLYADDDHVFRYTGKDHSIIPTGAKGVCGMWAPDPIYLKEMGKYALYYCTSSTWNASTLGFALSDRREGPYEWAGDLLYSGLTLSTLPETDVYDYVPKEIADARYVTADGEYCARKYPNALDPAVFYDEEDRLWMVYGSWSGGIFLLELDKYTGQVIHPEEEPDRDVDAYFGKKLMGGWHHSIEGPYIQWDPESGYYYLFVSFGWLGREGGYQIRVFRSKKPDGEYLDMRGDRPDYSDSNSEIEAGLEKNDQDQFVDHGRYGLKLSGNYGLPGMEMACMATGHNSAMIQEKTGKRYLCYHTRFDNGTERFEPQVKQYFLNREGWPCLLPYETSGEEIREEGYASREICGRYYVMESGERIDAKVPELVILYLTEQGEVVSKDGSVGNWSETPGSPYMEIRVGESGYQGVFCTQKDPAGAEVMVFTAVGENRSLWGVKYL